MAHVPPDLLLRIRLDDDTACTARLSAFLNDNGEEYDGQHAEWIADLQAHGAISGGGGAAPMWTVEVIDPATETGPEMSARSRAWTASGHLCPQCANSGRVYAGPAIDWGFHVPSHVMAEQSRRYHIEGPFAACPLGCATPAERNAATVAATREILDRRAMQVAA